MSWTYITITSSTVLFVSFFVATKVNTVKEKKREVQTWGSRRIPSLSQIGGGGGGGLIIVGSQHASQAPAGVV